MKLAAFGLCALVIALLLPATATAAPFKQIAFSSDESDVFPYVFASEFVKRPKAFKFELTGTAVPIDGSYERTCFRGSRNKSSDGAIEGIPPVTVVFAPTLRRPEDCFVSVDATTVDFVPAALELRLYSKKRRRPR